MTHFEKQGYWWLPENPTLRVPGTLTFDPETGGKLSLLGSFEQSERRTSIKIRQRVQTFNRVGGYYRWKQFYAL